MEQKRLPRLGSVYGYSLHLVDNHAGLAKLIQVEAVNLPEKVVMD